MTVRIRKGVRGVDVFYARGDYDFTKQGGAIGTIPLMGRALIPAGVSIIDGWVEVLTGVTSGGAATAAIQIEAANDVVPAQVLGTWTVGRKAIVPALDTSAVLAPAKIIRTTAKRDISLVIAAAALTAGKFSVFVRFHEPLR